MDRETFPVTVSASVTKYGTLEGAPFDFDFIGEIMGSQANAVLTQIKNELANPRLLIEFYGTYYCTDLTLGDTIEFKFDTGDELDRAFMGLVASESDQFRVIEMRREPASDDFYFKVIEIV